MKIGKLNELLKELNGLKDKKWRTEEENKRITQIEQMEVFVHTSCRTALMHMPIGAKRY